MSRKLIWKRLVLPLSTVLFVSLAVLVVLYVLASADGRAQLETEAGKAMLYVIAAVLIGNIVLAIVRDFEERRKAWHAQRDLLRADLTDGLSELYSDAKSTRRRLRASANMQTAVIDANKYDELLQEVNDTQLGFERYKRAAKAAARAGLLSESIAHELGSMDEYLHRLVTEYEKVLPSERPNIPLADLPQLADFIGPYTSSKFRLKFVGPYARAAKDIADEVQKALPRSKKVT